MRRFLVKGYCPIFVQDAAITSGHCSKTARPVKGYHSWIPGTLLFGKHFQKIVYHYSLQKFQVCTRSIKCNCHMCGNNSVTSVPWPSIGEWRRHLENVLQCIWWTPRTCLFKRSKYKSTTALNLKSFIIFICTLDLLNRPAVMLVIKIHQIVLLYKIKLLNLVWTDIFSIYWS